MIVSDLIILLSMYSPGAKVVGARETGYRDIEDIYTESVVPSPHLMYDYKSLDLNDVKKNETPENVIVIS